jgi:predicted transcriptional regulator
VIALNNNIFEFESVNGYNNAYDNIVPAARALIAKRLSQQGINEDKIAHILGVTQAAISKYITNKYSEAIKDTESKIDKTIVDKYIDYIVNGKEEYTNACICAICKSMNNFNCKLAVSV